MADGESYPVRVVNASGVTELQGTVTYTSTTDQPLPISGGTLSGNLTVANLTATGDTLLGNAASDKLGVLGAAAVVQQAHIADPAGGVTQDAEARTAIAAILDALEAYGFLALV